jgi:hypothetical protein
VREDAQGRLPQPPRLTVRVCDGISCDLAGARELLARLPALLQADVRVLPAPCVGRCEQAPVAVVHQHPVPQATADAVLAAVTAGRTTHTVPEPYTLTTPTARRAAMRCCATACRAGARWTR